MSAASITIHEFEVRYQMAGIQQDAALAQTRLDRIAREQLMLAWDQCTTEAEAEESHCFIDHLAFALTLDLAAADDHEIARRWAARLYDAVHKKIRSGVGIVFFKNRAHYLAAFVTALLQGTAASDPCLREFLPYSTMDRGTAAVEALRSRPEDGRDALVVLCESGQLSPLMQCLSDELARGLWTHCLAPGTPATLTRTYQQWVRRLLSFLPGHPLPRMSEPKELITLYLEFLRAHPDMGPDTNLAVFLRQLIRLRHEHLSGKATHIQEESQTEFDGHELESSGEFLQRLIAKVGEADSLALLQSLSPQVPPATVQRVFSRAAGLFLLLPLMEDCQLTSFLRTQQSDSVAGMQPTSLLRYLLGLQWLGHWRHGMVKDAGLLLFAGLKEAPEWSSIEKYAKSLSQDNRDAMLAWVQKSEESWQRDRERAAEVEKARVPADLSFLPIDCLTMPEEHLHALDKTLAAVASFVLREFTRRLGAFAESSVDFLARNFFVLEGELESDDESVVVHFITCPMEVLLRMTGVVSSERPIPEIENRKLRFIFPGG